MTPGPCHGAACKLGRAAAAEASRASCCTCLDILLPHSDSFNNEAAIGAAAPAVSSAQAGQDTQQAYEDADAIAAVALVAMGQQKQREEGQQQQHSTAAGAAATAGRGQQGSKAAAAGNSAGAAAAADQQQQPSVQPMAVEMQAPTVVQSAAAAAPGHPHQKRRLSDTAAAAGAPGAGPKRARHGGPRHGAPWWSPHGMQRSLHKQWWLWAESEQQRLEQEGLEQQQPLTVDAAGKSAAALWALMSRQPMAAREAADKAASVGLPQTMFALSTVARQVEQDAAAALPSGADGRGAAASAAAASGRVQNAALAVFMVPGTRLQRQTHAALCVEVPRPRRRHAGGGSNEAAGAAMQLQPSSSGDGPGSGRTYSATPSPSWRPGSEGSPDGWRCTSSAGRVGGKDVHVGQLHLNLLQRRQLLAKMKQHMRQHGVDGGANISSQRTPSPTTSQESPAAAGRVAAARDSSPTVTAGAGVAPAARPGTRELLHAATAMLAGMGVLHTSNLQFVLSAAAAERQQGLLGPACQAAKLVTSTAALLKPLVAGGQPLQAGVRALTAAMNAAAVAAAGSAACGPPPHPSSDPAAAAAMSRSNLLKQLLPGLAADGSSTAQPQLTQAFNQLLNLELREPGILQQASARLAPGSACLSAAPAGTPAGTFTSGLLPPAQQLAQQQQHMGAKRPPSVLGSGGPQQALFMQQQQQAMMHMTTMRPPLPRGMQLPPPQQQQQPALARLGQYTPREAVAIAAALAGAAASSRAAGGPSAAGSFV